MRAPPFESSEYGFDIKWDGIRALAAVEASPFETRTTNFSGMGQCLPRPRPDGELVACDADGRPDLPRLLRRHGLTSAWKIGLARRYCPVQYVLFDLLYHRGRCLVGALSRIAQDTSVQR